MPILLLIAAVLILVLLITVVKLHPFLSFLLVSIAVGIATNMEVGKIVSAVQKGIGDIMGSLLVILIVGAMLGKLVADSGAANKIADSLIQVFGNKRIQWALVATAFIVGIPLFYGVGFVLLVPLVITIAEKYKIPAVYLGLPTLAALSVTHGYLPPHPSPVALAEQFHADLGNTLLYGFLIAIPAIIIAGPVFSVTLKKYQTKPLAIFTTKNFDENKLPNLVFSLLAAFNILISTGFLK